MKKENIRLAIGSDETSEIADLVLDYLNKNNFEYELFGALKKGDNPNWVNVAKNVAGKVARKEFDQAILLCWTGTGVSIIANKIKGIRAALCFDKGVAEGARRWNDANILVMSNGFTNPRKVNSILNAWFSSKPSSIKEEKEDIERLKKC